jgi:putative transposase
MARKRYKTEQIIGHLREAEVRLGQGQTVGTICRGLSITEQTYYRWRREYGGLKLDLAPLRGAGQFRIGLFSNLSNAHVDIGTEKTIDRGDHLRVARGGGADRPSRPS